MVTGGQHSNRVALSCGRYGIIASREEQWCTYFTLGAVELNFAIAPLEYNNWVHFAIVWDGMVLRTYISGMPMSAVEPQEQAHR